MRFLSTTTGRIVLFVCLLALLRLAFLPASVPHLPPATGAFGGFLTVPAHGYQSCPVSARFDEQTVPTICVFMLPQGQPPSEIRLMVWDPADLPKWRSGQQPRPVYDSKTLDTRQIAIPLSPSKSRGAGGGEHLYYVVLQNEEAVSKTFLATIWVDQVPRGMLFYQQAVWMLRFLLFILGVMILVASRKRTPRAADDVYAVPPSMSR